MINPTGGAIRNDAMGNGHYGASRGNRKHDGVDYLCNAYQRVVAPISGKVNRVIQVYKSDSTWVGVEIVGRRATVQLFYVKVTDGLIGQHVVAGDVVGIAQAIGKKYNNGGPAMMQDHVHMRITSVDPECFVGV